MNKRGKCGGFTFMSWTKYTIVWSLLVCEQEAMKYLLFCQSKATWGSQKL